MKTFNLILSKIFQISLVFLLFFMWIRFYEKNLWNAVAYSAILTFIFDIIITKLTEKRDIKSQLKQADLKKADSISNHFIFSDKKEALNFYYDFLTTKYSSIKKNDFIIFTSENKNNILVPYYIYDKMTPANLVTIYKKIKKLEPKKVIICGANFDSNSRNFAKSLPINFVLLDKYESYNSIMKQNNFYPKNNFNFKPRTNGFSTILKYALNKKRAKAYIFSSLVLILSSFFVKVSVYYLIISSILLLLSIFSFSNKKFNKSLPENLL